MNGQEDEQRDGWGDGQMKTRMGGWKKRWMDRYLDVRMCDWMEGEIYFYNFPTSKKNSKKL